MKPPGSSVPVAANRGVTTTLALSMALMRETTSPERMGRAMGLLGPSLGGQGQWPAAPSVRADPLTAGSGRRPPSWGSAGGFPG
ncbi:hypothetical protein CKO38_09680 [Rhodospirillum rubrum]|nr:hypothetical protein [Rhodospirillum rubrum]MBK1676929.1 hypothetical protein [Rhodospirillum rubrum]